MRMPYNYNGFNTLDVLLHDLNADLEFYQFTVVINFNSSCLGVDFSIMEKIDFETT